VHVNMRVCVCVCVHMKLRSSDGRSSRFPDDVLATQRFIGGAMKRPHHFSPRQAVESRDGATEGEEGGRGKGIIKLTSA